MADRSPAEAICIVDGEPADWVTLLPAAVQNYGHITMMQMRGRMVRGLRHHLERLDAANRELFGRPLSPQTVLESLAIAAAMRPDATVRVNVFEGEACEHVMVTATAPLEPEWRPLRFSLVPFERDMPHLKHVGSFGLILRQRRAQAEGYDGAVFLDRNGQISEATIWNVGFFENGEVVWPAAPALRGISQILIDEGLAKLGVAVRYEPIGVEDLGRFDAAFLSNSATYGQLLGAIGSQAYPHRPDVSDLVRRAYELTPFSELRP